LKLRTLAGSAFFNIIDVVVKQINIIVIYYGFSAALETNTFSLLALLLTYLSVSSTVGNFGSTRFVLSRSSVESPNFSTYTRALLTKIAVLLLVFVIGIIFLNLSGGNYPDFPWWVVFFMTIATASDLMEALFKSLAKAKSIFYCRMLSFAITAWPKYILIAEGTNIPDLCAFYIVAADGILFSIMLKLVLLKSFRFHIAGFRQILELIRESWGFGLQAISFMLSRRIDQFFFIGLIGLVGYGEYAIAAKTFDAMLLSLVILESIFIPWVFSGDDSGLHTDRLRRYTNIVFWYSMLLVLLCPALLWIVVHLLEIERLMGVPDILLLLSAQLLILGVSTTRNAYMMKAKSYSIAKLNSTLLILIAPLVALVFGKNFGVMGIASAPAASLLFVSVLLWLNSEEYRAIFRSQIDSISFKGVVSDTLWCIRRVRRSR
jgi:O-antigen/teichoic acid export membrane protein